MCKSRVVQRFFFEGHIQIKVIDGGRHISGVASVTSLRGGKKGVVGGAKGCGSWRETRELTRGRGLFPLPW